MPEQILRVRGLEPLLFRDARPFSDEIGGLTARSLPQPMPRTLAGFVRTSVGRAEGGEPWGDHAFLKNLKAIPVHGPLLSRERDDAETVMLPAPRDALVASPKDAPAESGPRVFTLRPWTKGMPAGAGCDLPEDGLLPLQALPEDCDAGKPAGGYAYWPWPEMADWLASTDGVGFALPEKVAGLPREERVHNGIDPETGKSKDGMLFSVEYAGFEAFDTEHGGERWSLLARAGLPEGGKFARVGSLGGERRLAETSALLPESRLWPGGDGKRRVLEALRGAKRVRMVLATPALFDGGWKPGWLDFDTGDVNTRPRGLSSGIRFKLAGASVGRREPVSGWSLRGNGLRGVRWAVPAGSVYFFDVVDGDPAALAESAWLRPVSDGEQDRNDGFGLALWGVW